MCSERNRSFQCAFNMKCSDPTAVAECVLTGLDVVTDENVTGQLCSRVAGQCDVAPPRWRMHLLKENTFSRCFTKTLPGWSINTRNTLNTNQNCVVSCWMWSCGSLTMSIIIMPAHAWLAVDGSPNAVTALSALASRWFAIHPHTLLHTF